MLCPSCGAPVGRGIDECPQCGSAVYEKDRKNMSNATRPIGEIVMEGKLFAARHDQYKYQLAPKGELETNIQFCNRIDHDKTPFVVRHNESIAKRMTVWCDAHGINTSNPLFQRLNTVLAKHTNPTTREPGCDDE